jgi:murein DD-endopeptidase MepM/ murein hydrolase activator NlpD
VDKYYTLMIIPEKEKKVKSLKIPGIFFRSFAFVIVLVSTLIGILMYDYWKILQQIHENKHLNLENRQLREQIQLFQMKINSLASDLQRINTFEKKLRIITGLEDTAAAQVPLVPASNDLSEDPSMDDYNPQEKNQNTKIKPPVEVNQSYNENNILKELDFEKIEQNYRYQELKTLYDKKIAANLGLTEKYKISRQWSELIKKSFELSKEYTSFDFKYKKVKDVISNIEIKIHELDQFLLDKSSILKSTPTILPSNGWITSYFGHRLSPYAGRVKMHEGLDIGAPYGTPIFAPADGIITFSGLKAGFGKFVQIDHGYGIETLYAHSQKLIVRKGDKVKRGELIAKVGSTGYSTGPHLHYEVRVNGIAVDPLYFVLSN